MGRKSSLSVDLPADEAGSDAFDARCLRLLQDAVSRDEMAFRRLYDLTVGRVYHLAHRITGRADLAEDTVVDVYFQAWKEAACYDVRRGRVMTWLLMMCRTRALDNLRRCDPAEAVSDTETLASFDSEGERAPDTMVLLLERNHAVHRAILHLTAPQRQVVSLAFLRGLTHEEIARCAAMPLGTVKSHLRKALELLRRELVDHRTNP